MLDPLSLAAITSALGAVGLGMANEAGKRAWESAGGLVRRVTGRPVPAPAGPADRAAVARAIHEGVHRDPAHAREWLAFTAGLPAPATATAVPRLPPSVRHFTDREDRMKLIGREAFRPPDGRPRLALLHGPEGIGTSALAVHWGCREAGRFPDGQLYADLRGDDSAGGALRAGPALGSLLRQLGVTPGEVPPTADDRAELFQRLVSGRQLLLVLDHAHSAAQVRPLLTSAPGVFTLIAAQRPLPGLDTLDIPVGPLGERDARRLLGAVAGKQAMSAAKATLPSLLAECAGSPYALRTAAQRLGAPAPAPGASPALAGDPLVRAAGAAYRSLDPATARVFRLAALRPWPAVTPAVAAGAAGLTGAEALDRLDELADRQLLLPCGEARYRYRPAVREHARELALREDGYTGCAAAEGRTLRGLLELAEGAAHAALPQSWRVPAPASAPGPAGTAPDTGPAGPTYPDSGAALRALEAEAENLAHALDAAEELGDHQTVLRLARSLWPVQLKAGRHEELLPGLLLAARTADAHAPGTRAAGAVHAQLAHTLTELRRFPDAERHARAAVGAEEAAGHPRGHASAVEFLGLLRLREWRYDEAYPCFEEAGRIYDSVDPGDEGAADLPRARALLERHRGRALRGMSRYARARELLESAVNRFGELGDAYNTARALTDLAETHAEAGDPAAALAAIDRAVPVLEAERATYALDHLRGLRARCVAALSRPPE
ncbi:tetratricopeptide repeat protein [Streptomyces sp. LP05-1]|uniref:Tetratricopeptide repeat protein n=1 Tax=Streptomyces pyxinae TaxID=2970734 RepID=A0ABT2CJA4_9ACTN|nr:tetratricopeptide repeat protein [Streptomyces sp. LP05-1]MCS0637488.1 tetratricopeptide repeat protein [Streptomyces sp. LP05-1]